MRDVLVGLARSPGGLSALVSRRRRRGPDIHGAEHRPTDGRLGRRYKLVVLCPDEVPPDAVPDALSRAWRHLGAVTVFDAEALTALLIVLLETTVLEEARLDPGSLNGWGEPPKGRVATAAHPRAYRGTRTSPPRPATPAALDLRGYACHPAATRLLLGKGEKVWCEAVRRLARQGYATEPLLGPVSDPRRAALFPDAPERVSVPRKFALWLLPSLGGLPWRQVERLLGLYWRLGLEQSDHLMAGVTRLARLAAPESLHAWCALVESQPPERRAVFLAQVLDAQASACDPEELLSCQIPSRLASADEARYAPLVYYLSRSLSSGVDVGYLLHGLTLVEERQVRCSALEVKDGCAALDLDFLRSLAVDDPGSHRHCILDLWECCGSTRHFYAALREFPWHEFSHQVASDILDGWLGMPDAWWNPNTPDQRWEIVYRLRQPFLQALRGAPAAYQRKFVELYYDCCYYRNPDDGMKPFLQLALRFVTRVCRPPFDQRATTGDVLCLMAEQPEPLRQALGALPDMSFKAVEKACRRGNPAELVSSGLSFLLEFAGEATVTALERFPARLLAVARLLGTLSRRQAAEVFLSAQRAADWPGRLDDLCRAVTESVPLTAHHRIPRRLRLATGVAFDDADFPEEGRLLRSRLPLCWLDLLAREARQVLARGLPVDGDGDAEFHGLQLLNTIKENRRALRRFFRAGADPAYLLSHPSARAWLAAHPELPVDAWLRGLRRTYHHEQVGRVTIALEQDPFEALRLGTHAGTCLGVGGAMAFSAAAVLLDLNKQVYYARNAAGQVVARQLVALSENSTLVCYRPYADRQQQEYEELFRRFDHQLAAELGLPIHRYGMEDHRIALILAEEYYDDQIWDVDQEQDETL